MNRYILRMMGTLLVSACFGNSIAQACDVPAPLKSIDPPGFYDDPTGYTQAVKPMRDYIAKLNHAADSGQWACTMDLLDAWARADALMGLALEVSSLHSLREFTQTFASRAAELMGAPYFALALRQDEDQEQHLNWSMCAHSAVFVVVCSASRLLVRNVMAAACFFSKK